VGGNQESVRAHMCVGHEWGVRCAQETRAGGSRVGGGHEWVGVVSGEPCRSHEWVWVTSEWGASGWVSRVGGGHEWGVMSRLGARVGSQVWAGDKRGWVTSGWGSRVGVGHK